MKDEGDSLRQVSNRSPRQFIYQTKHLSFPFDCLVRVLMRESTSVRLVVGEEWGIEGITYDLVESSSLTEHFNCATRDLMDRD